MTANLPTPTDPARQLAKPEDPSGLRLLPKKLPRELVEESDRELVLAECRAAVDAAEPAKLPEFALVVERLALHYPENRLSEREREIVMKDWRRLLGHLPADILAQAADEWIMSPARFFPTCGQLSALAEPKWAWRKALAKRARDTLEMMPGG